MKIEIPEGYEARINGNEVVLEPKENEDERIRKKIIDYLNFAESHNLLRVADYKKKKGWLAYLERQEEQKPANIDYISGIRDELLRIEDNAKNIDGLTESQWVAIRAAHRLLGEYLNSNQKPAEWNEEDDAAFGDLMWCIEQARRFAKDENDMGNIWFAENWVKKHIKSLRSQPKAKWSKEDEKMLSIAIYMVRNSKTFIYSGVTKFEVSDFLKSIKDKAQSTFSWKPSKEQMEALWEVEDRMRTNRAFTLSNRLASLYNDLKKL